MLRESLHAFEYRDHLVVFNKDELVLRLFPPIDDLNSPTESVTEPKVAQLFGDIPDWQCEPEAPELPANIPSTGASPPVRPVLGRLTLTISNVCNMSCSYCYAAGGTYYNTQGLFMSRETALNAINRASSAFSTIHHINFFGGEPTLNKEIIELVCEYVFYLYDRGVLTSLPSFGITTNGYSIDERMFEILTGYNFSVTLSLDGPQQVHDLKRLTKSGKGTYDSIVKNIRALMERGIPIEFECTYSSEHLRQGIDLVALMDFFYDNFQCRTLHAPIVSAAPGTPDFIPLNVCLKLQGDAIEYSLRNLRSGIPKSISTATRMLQSLTSRTPILNYCPAGRSAITINADGNIYACFMLMQHTGFSYGNVNGQPSSSFQSDAPSKTIELPTLSDSRPRVIQGLIADSDKQRHPACQKCWAQPLCHGCLGEDLERRGSNVFRSEVPGESEFCDYKRGLADIFLHSVAEAHFASKVAGTPNCDVSASARNLAR